MPIRRALVVDDSKAAGLALRRMLEQHNIAVDLAESGEAALTYLQAQQPDLIFMDHIMPGMNGLETAKAISSEPKTAAIPIVMYTSTEGDAYVEKAKAHGAVGILPKPPKAPVLAQWIQQLGGSVEKAPAAPVAVPAPPAAVAIAPAMMSIEAMETMARGVAESVVRNATQTLVTRTLEEQLPQMRQDILARCETIARQVAAEFLHARVNELSNQVRTMQEQLTHLGAQPAEAVGVGTTGLAEVETLARAVAEQAAVAAATKAAQTVAKSVAQQTATEAVKGVANDSARALEEFFKGRVSPLVAQLRAEVQSQLSAVLISPPEPRLSAAALKELTNTARETATQAATQAAINAATQTAQNVAQTVAQQATADIATSTADAIARRVATEVSEAHGQGLLAQLKRDVSGQLAELRARKPEPGALPPEALDEVKSVAKHIAQQRVTESVQRAVEEALQHSGQDLAKQAARLAARQLDKAMEIATRSQMSRVYFLTAAAAAVGVFAAFIVHLLH